MSELKICRICLRTEAKGFKYELYQLKCYYEEVTAIKVNDQDGLPKWFCYECAYLLHKFHKFKEKCYIGGKILKDMILKGPLTYGAVFKINRPPELIISSIEPIKITEHIKSYITIHEEDDPLNNDIGHSGNNNVTNNDADSANNDIKENIMIHNNLKHIKDKINIMKFERDTQSKAKNADGSEFIENSDNVKNDIDNYSDNYCKENKVNSRTNEDTKYNDNDINEMEAKGNNHHDLTFTNNIQIDTNFEVKSENKNKAEINITEPISPKHIIIEAENPVELQKDRISSKFKNTDIHLTFDVMNNLNKDHWEKIDLSEEAALKEFRDKSVDVKYVNAQFKCTDCFKGFSKKEMLKRHLQLRHSESMVHECRICRMRFKWRSHLRRHLSQHYTKYQCLRCPLVFNIQTSLILHDQYHSGETKKCNYCDEEFNHRSTYYTHVRSHRCAHACARCGRTFHSGAGLRKHCTQHQDESASDDDIHQHCDKCDITFDGRKAYEEHLFQSTNHTEVLRIIKSKGKVVLGEDQETIENTKKILGKKLRRIITKDLKQCSTDNVSPPPTKTKRSRRPPKRIYKKPTKCQQPGSVSSHMRIHEGGAPHRCPHCARAFHVHAALKRHMLTHTGEKPYGCPLCEKRFTQSNSMKLHYRTYHLKQPYPKRNKRVKSTNISNKHVKTDAVETSNESLIQYKESTEMRHNTTEHMEYLTLN